jgi:hypothetical protein
MPTNLKTGDLASNGQDQLLVMCDGDRLFLRWFAQADGFARLLQNANRQDDDVVIFTGDGVRVEVSLHDTATDCLRAREDTIRQVKERGRDLALAVARPGGRA